MTSLLTPSTAGRDSYAGLSAVLVADSADPGRGAAELLAAAGVRVRAQFGFEEACERLDDAGLPDLLVIEAADAADIVLDGLMSHVAPMADAGQLYVVATVSLDQIDIVAGRLFGPRVQILCDPSEAERAGAIALACARASASDAQGYLLPVMDDARREGEAAKLQRLNEEVARIAETLVRLSRGEDPGRRDAVQEPGAEYTGLDAGDFGPVTPYEIRAAIRARRMRAQFFDGELFADPAWDMLLDLFAAQLEDRSVSVSSLCIAAAVPPTTALRWIGSLHQAGLFERRADPSDRRRAYIALSPKGLVGMREYVTAVKRAGLNLV